MCRRRSSGGGGSSSRGRFGLIYKLLVECTPERLALETITTKKSFSLILSDPTVAASWRIFPDHQ